MNELFAYAPEACKNTLKIADMIDIHIPHGKPLLPTYKLNEQEYILQKGYFETYSNDK
jgi:DNA polymerase III alpha subunit